MSARAAVKGFDYMTHQPVELPPVAWRLRYPPDKYRRTVENGETSYHSPRIVLSNGEVVETRIIAEAYAVIPAGKVSL